MRYSCSECRKEIRSNLLIFKAHFPDVIKEEIDRIHPHWTEGDALCVECLYNLQKSLVGNSFKTY